MGSMQSETQSLSKKQMKKVITFFKLIELRNENVIDKEYIFYLLI